jgi:dihydrofolate reductase
MGKLVVSEFISLDGVVEAPGGEESLGERSGWTFPYVSGEFRQFKRDELFAGEALLLGRRTYEGFAAAWPGAKDDDGFADRMNGLPKYVASSSLRSAGWNNSVILSRDIEGRIEKLRQGPGGDILVFGSAGLARWLRDRNLVDEWRLLLYPVVLGAGKRLFADSPAAIPLALLEARRLEKGLVLLSYGRASA